MGIGFEVLARDGAARRARLSTPHGVIETPCFMPVGTLGAVKGMPAQDLVAAGASIMLSNLYHLTLRPGIDRIAGLGGIHRFTGWSKPIITDSGGFQVWSLASLRKVDEDGVTFRSHLDGTAYRFTPRTVVESQRKLGVDIAMVLDECPPWPIDEREAAASWARTLRWAEQARVAWDEALESGLGTGAPGGLFGIVQGSAFEPLRVRAAEALRALDFDGYAIGGVSVGEDKDLRRAVVEWTAPCLPADRPRYLMGLGTPLDLLHAVRHGVDLFDCVMPSRNARHGMLFTRDGVVKIKNAQWADDPSPIDEHCSCALCRDHSRAFLHHLMRARELTGVVLATLHNLRFYLDFMQDVREGIELGSLTERAAEVVRRYSR